MSDKAQYDLFRILARVLYLAAGLYILLRFLNAVTGIILLFAVAGILAIALNPPVTWLEDRRIPRVIGTILVLLVIAGVIALIAWQVLPRLVAQATALAAEIPNYVSALTQRASRLAANNPSIQQRLQLDPASIRESLPSVWSVLLRIGRYSLSILTALFFAFLLLLVTIYMLVRPRPLLKGYLDVMPAHLREPAARAFEKSSIAIWGWVTANVIVGSIEAVLAGVFLTLIGMPGALIWGALAFFSELIPQIGGYIMMIPPILVALAVDPWMALWVFLFYETMQTVMSNVVAPIVRSSQMNLHPISLIFAVLAMASVFGFLGAIIATPVLGIVKAYYDEFYLARRSTTGREDREVEQMLAWWKDGARG